MSIVVAQAMSMSIRVAEVETGKMKQRVATLDLP